MTYKTFISRLFVYLKPHLGKLIFTTLVMVLATALESSVPEITGRIVDELFTTSRSEDKTLVYSLILFGVFLLSSVFNLISNSTSSWVSNKVIMDLRVHMFKKLLDLPKSFFDKLTTGKLISKLTFDVEQIASVASTIWLVFIKSLLTVVILVGYLFYKNWQLSISLILILPIIFLAVRISANRMHSLSQDVQSSMGELTHILDENISGQNIIKIFQADKVETKKFNQLIQKIRQKRFKVDFTAGVNTNLINVLLGLALSFVVYYSSVKLQMTGGQFLSYFTALAMLIKPAKTLIDMNKPLQIAFAAGESVFGLIDEPPENNPGKSKVSNLNGEIVFDHVSFSYGGDKLILDDLNFRVNAGETIAIVGPTGSGKTTIIELISKFYAPTSGQIYFDGIDIQNIENYSLRSNISYVDQNTRLFNDSVTNNIALGDNVNKEDGYISDIAKRAEAYDFILNLDQKFDTNIGDNGKLLSGGQRQRLAIARAMAKDAPILILDEATSALDSSTENLVQKAISNMTENRTTIIIAHRLSTIQNADKIIVLDNGKILEEGSHRDLIKKKGFYSKLIEDQYK
jgi:subfamily B ATP-binding cassette protein MsbA